MYEKYHTEALVLAGRESGEADKVFALYTHDFGLVRARASGVRAEHSKMRYAMRQYGYASVSLVKGTRGWRVAGARALSGSFPSIEALRSFARITELALRLIVGEDRNEYAFKTLSSMHTALCEEGARIEDIELLAVARLLYALGYLPQDSLPADTSEHTSFDKIALDVSKAEREVFLQSVNQALMQTQL